MSETIPPASDADTPPDTSADAATPDAATDAAGETAGGTTPAADAGPAPGLTPAACGQKLAELFPALFGSEGPPKPIKLRIHVDLQARAPGVFSRRVLGPFFARYTTSNAYLKALANATQRFDLDGQPAGEVTQEHRDAAVAELARRREIAIAKRVAERAATRPPAGSAPDAAADGAERPARPPRGQPRPDRRRERNGPARDTGPGAEAGARGPRPPRPPRPAPRDRAPAPRRDASGPRPQRPAVDAAPVPEPQDPAQRDRAQLLRQFESSPLTKANFCVLRRIAEADLDAQLALARQERDARRRG